MKLISRLSILAICTLGTATLRADAVTDWQTNRLLSPSPEQLAREQQGEVFIYDGLPQSMVEQGMDEGFDRIDHMMFIRTRLPPTAAGEPEEFEDDCD